MNPSTKAEFDQRYQTHLKHRKLKGLQPKTIDAYSRTIRRMGDYFDYATDNLSPAQLTNYFSGLIETHSWSAVKLDLYGFKFYTLHVLGKPWVMPNFIKPPTATPFTRAGRQKPHQTLSRAARRKLARTPDTGRLGRQGANWAGRVTPGWGCPHTREQRTV